MTKIIRTKTRATGGITESERQQMSELSKVWIARAFRTDPIEPEKITGAIERLYAAADLKKPRVVIVPSPLIMAASYGASAATWHTRGKSATDAATSDATYEATDAANIEAEALQACANIAGELGVACARRWSNVYQGGNMWAPWASYIAACRDVLGLDLPAFQKYQAWEDSAIHGGFRAMHEEFCIVSDFPEVLKVDDQNRPHCENGPSHKWRDGWSLYHWHGVKVPAAWIENKSSLTPEIALTWENVEQRRAACEILGWHNVLEHPSLKPKIIDADEPHIGTLIEVNLQDAPKQWFLKYQCGTGRWFAESVNDKTFNTALKANAGGNGWRGTGDPLSFIPFIRS